MHSAVESSSSSLESHGAPRDGAALALPSSGCDAQPCQSFGLESKGRIDEFGVSGRKGWLSPSAGIEAGGIPPAREVWSLLAIKTLPKFWGV